MIIQTNPDAFSNRLPALRTIRFLFAAVIYRHCTRMQERLFTTLIRETRLLLLNGSLPNNDVLLWHGASLYCEGRRVVLCPNPNNAMERFSAPPNVGMAGACKRDT